MSLVMKLILEATSSRTLSQFAEQCRAPMPLQEKLLAHILKDNRDTAFGRAHGLGELQSVGQFKRRVPIQNYDDHKPYIEAAMNGVPAQLTRANPIFYATTSGTTGASKYIPVTPESRAAKSQLTRIALCSVYRDRPGVLSGKILLVISPEVESYAPSGAPCGAETGHAFRNMPKALQSVYSSPYEVFLIKNYEARYYTLVRVAAGQPISLILACNPSTVVLLADRLAQHTESIIRDVRDGTLAVAGDIPPEIRSVVERGLRPDPARAKALERAAAAGGGVLLPRETWPELKGVNCWKGGTVGMYLEKFPRFLPAGLPVRDMGYVSSEHRGSVALSDEGSGGVLAVGTNFYEFYPADEERKPRPLDLLGADELEVGQRYFIYVTTLGGLYRYDMNDIVEVVGMYENTPVIRFVQKGKGVVSFTGEKLYESQVIAAVASSLGPLQARSEFIAAVGLLDGETPRYVFLMEFDEDLADDSAVQLARKLDAALGELNIEYAAKRESKRLAGAGLRIIRRGEFDRYRARMVAKGRVDAQFKILRLTADAEFANEFEVERKALAD